MSRRLVRDHELAARDFALVPHPRSKPRAVVGDDDSDATTTTATTTTQPRTKSLNARAATQLVSTALAPVPPLVQRAVRRRRDLSALLGRDALAVLDALPLPLVREAMGCASVAALLHGDAERDLFEVADRVRGVQCMESSLPPRFASKTSLVSHFARIQPLARALDRREARRVILGALDSSRLKRFALRVAAFPISAFLAREEVLKLVAAYNAYEDAFFQPHEGFHSSLIAEAYLEVLLRREGMRRA